MNTVVWKCEQFLAGRLQDRSIFGTEEEAKAFARKLNDAAPDVMLRIESMPIKHVWN